MSDQLKKISALTNAFFLSFLTRTKSGLAALSQTDTQWIIILVTVSTLLRFPMLEHPYYPQLDEGVIVSFIASTIEGTPFFDIHPPLIKIIFAEIAEQFGPFSTRKIEVLALPRQSFGDFHYIPLRMLTAFFGVLLVLLVYAVGRGMKHRPAIAGTLALFIAIESAFVIYSRTMLPDTFLLVFEFGAITLLLFAIQDSAKTRQRTLIFLSALLLGCALSIKWTALGVMFAVTIFLLIKKEYTNAIFSLVTTGVVYMLTFALFFVFYFPNGGKVTTTLPAYDVPVIAETEFPVSPSLKDAILFIPKWHEVIQETNHMDEISNQLLPAPHPITWITADKSTVIPFWLNSDGGMILLHGNTLLWTTLFFLFIFFITQRAVNMFIHKQWVFAPNELFLIVGYIASYVPFFLIDRPMYLYHYFTPLLFLLLLSPVATSELLRCISLITKKNSYAHLALVSVVIAVITLSLASFPLVFGW